MFTWTSLSRIYLNFAKITLISPIMYTNPIKNSHFIQHIQSDTICKSFPSVSLCQRYKSWIEIREKCSVYITSQWKYWQLCNNLFSVDITIPVTFSDVTLYIEIKEDEKTKCTLNMIFDQSPLSTCSPEKIMQISDSWPSQHWKK